MQASPCRLASRTMKRASVCSRPSRAGSGGVRTVREPCTRRRGGARKPECPPRGLARPLARFAPWPLPPGPEEKPG